MLVGKDLWSKLKLKASGHHQLSHSNTIANSLATFVSFLDHQFTFFSFGWTCNSSD